MPSPVINPEYHLTLQQADQAREDFAAILSELDFLKEQLARAATRAWLGRMLLLALAAYGPYWACSRCGLLSDPAPRSRCPVQPRSDPRDWLVLTHLKHAASRLRL
jgi:hypothetical protein